MDICTIIAKNYVAYARVLARSFGEHHPDARVWVLVIDDFEGHIDPAAEPFEVVSVADLEIEGFDRMAALYSVVELSTAVKPWLLRYLLDRRGLERIVYLDPDIRVYDDLSEVDRLLQDARVVVTPHVTEPMPRDGRKPSERDILIAGAYNLGFIGLSRGQDTDRMLDWWADRLRRDCVVAPELGYFVDQRWIDFAPGLVERFEVLRDPGYNVAYWNLSSRQVSGRPGAWRADGSPLRFFHFSGFDPELPTALSKHQTRHSLEGEPALVNLCRSYADELLAAGYEEAIGWSYSWAELPNGLPLDAATRHAYRAAESEGAVARSVFSSEGAEELAGWLNEPAPVGAAAGLTRYLYGLHETRADLAELFPDIDGRDAPRLVRWAQAYGGEEGGVPQRLVPNGAPSSRSPDGGEPASAARASAGASPDVPSARPGVNVAGYFTSTLGVGEVGRQVVGALETQNIAVKTVGLTAGASRQGEDFAPRGAGTLDQAEHPINLICVNADAVEGFAKDAGAGFFADRYSIGFWWWEVAKFPGRWASSFDHVDEVWAGTRHVADGLALVSPVPVVKVRLPVSVPAFEPLDRNTLGLPEGFLFLLVFDYLSVFERKNPLALIRAFTEAFQPGEGAALAIKCINHEQRPEEHARLLEAAAAHPDVHVVDRYVSRAEKDAMIAASDCYASLHRAEGFGITLAEAMWLGKPVVATAYSGNLDFMSERNSYLVDYQLTPIGDGADPYPADGEWAEPNPADAARAMRAVFDDQEEAARRARRGQEEIRATHSPEATGREMAERLTRARADLAARRRGSGAQSSPRPIDTRRIAALIRGGATQGSPPSRLAGLKRAARQALLRVIKPYSVHQEEVDKQLLAAIDRLSVAVAGGPREGGAVELEAELPFMADSGFGEMQHPVAGVVTGYRGGGRAGGGEKGAYHRFEDVFRGPEELIRERQRRYLELIDDRQPVLDAGCGRGEFLGLLRERRLDYVGVDSDPELIAYCRSQGHESVETADVIDWLSAREDSSLGAIFSAQVIEHLPYEALLRFFELSLRKLKPGGLLIAETVNPHSPRAMKNFWVDPTHQHPVFPEVALTLSRIAGFDSGFVFHPNGSGNVDLDRSSESEYAVVAEKAGPSG